MNSPKKIITDLTFSKKYNKQHAQKYYDKHRSSLRHKLTTWREIAIARQALKVAGNPKVILDLPCGAGRFWSMLAEKEDRTLFASDFSEHMIEVAKEQQSPDISKLFTRFQSSAFDIKMDDRSVDNIFCMRLLHHIANSQDRMAILNEFNRVTRDTVCLSTWVMGNIQSKRRIKLERNRGQHFKNRLVLPIELVENEYKQAGFDVIKYIDVLPKISMWRIYVLKKHHA